MSDIPRQMPFLRTILDAILLTLAAAGIYVVSALKIYYGNLTDFVFPISDMIPVAGLWTLYLFVVVVSVLLLFRWLAAYRHLAVLLLLVTAGVWVQSNLFNWSYGSLDGSTIAWGQFAWEGFFELAFFVGLFLLSMIFARKVYVAMPYVLAMLIAMQVGDAWATARNAIGPDMGELYVIDESNKFVFGGEQNVIIFILDAFQGSVFDEILQNTPEYANGLKGFTWFKNAAVAIPSTKLSIPHLLSGIPYNNSIPVRQYQRNVLLRYSLPTTLQRIGWHTEFYSVFGYGYLPVEDRLWSNARRKTSLMEHIDEYNKLFQAVNFRLSPQVIKKMLYDQGVLTTREKTRRYLVRAIEKMKQADVSPPSTPPTVAQISPRCCKDLPAGINPDVDFTNAMLGRVRTGANKRVLKVYHLQGLHPPRNIDEDFNVDPSLNEDSNSMPSSGRASLKLLDLFLLELKKAGLYDNSTIIVLADHGNSRQVNPSATSHHADLNRQSLRLVFDAVKGTAIPLVLVKPVDAVGPMQVSKAPVALGDVPNTVMAMIDGRQTFPGKSMFADINPTRERLFWIHAYHEEHFDYYGDLQEFSIKGDIYEDRAWTATGNLLRPSRTGVKKYYEERDAYLKGMLPLAPIVEKGAAFAIPPFGYLNGTFGAYRAFDKILRETGWMPVVSPNGKCANKAILGIAFDRAFILKAYSLKTRSDLQYQAPKDWTLEASNGGDHWVILHQVSGDAQWEPGGKVKVFHTEDNHREFSAYRLNITASQADSCIFIDEFELFE